MNWNVLYGFNHHRAIDPGAAWIKRENPDILGLQELNGNTPESLRKLAAKWGHKYSALQKTDGFPIGLTSREPIEVIERAVKGAGYHHGYMHCKTYGIHFFLVHFWPGKDNEALNVLKNANALLEKKEKVIIMGDFNANSRKDADFLAKSVRRTPSYHIVDQFENAGFVDLVYKHDKKAQYSCPSPITIPEWTKTMQELVEKRMRIDFIFADGILAKTSASGTISTSQDIEKISDHYPCIVTLTTTN